MLWTLGNAARDIVVSESGRSERPGGTVLFASLALRALGVPCGVAGHGTPEARAVLAACGVDVSEFRDGRAPRFVNRYLYGARFQRASPGDAIDVTRIPARVFDAPGILAGALLGELPASVATRPRAGTLFVDLQGFARHDSGRGEELGPVRLGPAPSFRAVLRHVDVVRGSRREARAITGRGRILAGHALDVFAREGVRVSIVTLGRRGGFVRDPDGLRRFDAFRVKEAEPTGAGDVFDATFLWRTTEGEPPTAAARYAAAAAAIAVSRRLDLSSPLSKFATRREVEALVASRK
ncbi:MAG: PfkB family carbohydrate kinase [Methanobacteriota archaeon]